ncbi:MAG: anti-sigma factor [Bacteroidia bacterium]
MNSREIISSGLLESYVLGNCTAEENLLVRELSSKYPEVLTEIEAIENALIQYSSAKAPTVPDAVKSRLMLKLNGGEEASVRNKGQSGPKWYGYAAAAAVVLLIVSSVVNVLLYSKVLRLSSDLAVIQQEKNYYVDQLNVQNVSLNARNAEVALLSNPSTKQIFLKSTDTTVNSKATIYWNTGTRETYLSLVQLPAPPQGKQYQLWAIVDGKPVDAGVFDVAANDTVLQKMKEISNAQAFAVTVEVAGGSPAPTLSTLCLMGNV